MKDVIERLTKLSKVGFGYDITFEDREALKDAVAALSASPAGVVKPLQSRVQPWMMACFGPEISADKLERSDRFIEEALELVQSGDYPKERVLALVDYVYGRDKGEMPQEVGGVMITLAAFCLAHDIDMHEAGETELARIWTKVDKIRAKQAAKPTGSALPVAARIMSAIEPAGVGVETEGPWRGMDSAPKDGKHSIFAIKFGPFVYAVQGTWDAHHQKWINAADREGEYLAWMPNIMLPDEFRPWTDEYKARASLKGDEQ